MRIHYYYKGKKVTKKYLEELLGKERLKFLIEDAKSIFMSDPNIALDCANGVSFKISL